MKFFATLTLLLGISLTAFAQPDVTAAYNYNRDGEFAKAAEYIEKGILNEKGKLKEKTWRYRGTIYFNIATDSTLRVQYPDAIKTSVESFMKANELDTRGSYEKDNQRYLNSLQNMALNWGVEYYNVGDYKGAGKYFDLSAEIAEKFGVTDTLAIFNGALSHEKAGELDKAITGYGACAALGYNVPNVYQFTSNLYKQKGDTTAAMEVIALAREKHPRDQNLIIEELNFYLNSGNLDKALDNLRLAAEQDPTNEVLHYNMGVVLDNNGQYAEAEAAYQKALEVNPDYFDALYNLGALFFNQGVEKVNTAREIKDNAKYEAAMAEADEIFGKGLPHLEKALELNPEDIQTIRSLRDIYVRVGEDDKFMEMSTKLKELGGN